VEVRRRPQAVACRQRSGRDLGKPHGAPAVGTTRKGYTAIEAQTGKPGNGARRESNAVGTTKLWSTATEAHMRKLGNRPTLEPNPWLENHDPGGRETATRPWGVLSGIVLGDGESPSHGEGPDGSTPPAKETRAGQVGLDQHGPTSLRATALGRMAYAQASTTEEPDAGKLHVRVRAGGAG